MDAPVLTKDQIRQLWTYSGGSAAYSDIASAVALATSGGRPDYVAQQSDGTVNRGLWGINSSRGQLSTNDPVANARGAIELSNGGRDWRDWPAAYDNSGYLGPTSPARNLAGGTSSLGQYPTAGNRPTTTVRAVSASGDNDWGPLGALLDFFGLGDLRNMAGVFVRSGWFILAGGSMMIVGLVLMFFGLRSVKNVGTFILETGASGIGFGAGAAVVSRGEKAVAGTAAPAAAVGASSPPAQANAPAPTPTGFRSITAAPPRKAITAPTSSAPTSGGPKSARMPVTSLGKMAKRPSPSVRKYRVSLNPVSGPSNPQPRRARDTPLSRPANPGRRYESALFSPPKKDYQPRHAAESD